jgi:hypothetical protein
MAFMLIALLWLSAECIEVWEQVIVKLQDVFTLGLEVACEEEYGKR